MGQKKGDGREGEAMERAQQFRHLGVDRLSVYCQYVQARLRATADVGKSYQEIGNVWIELKCNDFFFVEVGGL